MSLRRELGAAALARMTGMPAAAARAALPKAMAYEPLPAEAARAVAEEVSRRIREGPGAVSGPQRLRDWERGWGENLEVFKSSGRLPLVPRYFLKREPMRLEGRYVRPLVPRFELKFFEALKRLVFGRYLAGAPAVLEFGCGTGQNLLELARWHPGSRLMGLDWAESSVQLVNAMARRYRIPLQGRRFDMFHPDPDLEVPPGAVFLTVHSLEQLGRRHAALLDFLLAKKPRLCVHMEPLYELYDREDFLDRLAMRYHNRRNYLAGFLPRMKRLERQGALRIIKLKRVRLGSLFHEGHSLLVWEPV